MTKHKEVPTAAAELYPGDELGQRLCRIFGRYRYSFIQAKAPAHRKAKAQWKTEKYQVKHRVLYRDWLAADKLIGVRFGSKTLYALIDIDSKSKYHPNQSADSVKAIQEALETIGISRTITISSSWSEGLHIYIPLAELINTFNLAVAIKGCLEAQGFEVKPGQLEIFPNPKPFGVAITTEYLAHRLPLQPESGSHLLDDDLNFVSDQLVDFLNVWDLAAAGQDLELLRESLIAARNSRRERPRQRVSKVDEWREDLDTVISEGWTGSGQTNGLLKQIATYGRVFLDKCGGGLTDFIEKTAMDCPGYQRWCQHRHEIKRRASHWANSVEKLYFPIGTFPKSKSAAKDNVPSHNQRIKAQKAKGITDAVQQLESTNQLPENITARTEAILAIIGGSLGTLYKREKLPLWHPKHYKSSVIAEPTRDTAVEEVEVASIPKVPDLPDSKELRPAEPIMKCIGNEIPLKKFKNSSRGVRGEKNRFPQATPPPIPNSPVRHRQKVPAPRVVDREIELIQTLQHRFQELKWQWSKIQAFVDTILPGKRPSSLTDDDRLLLLYHLRDQTALC